jgi:uncharacterized metal-binding protein YceD (DUF177 family)
MEAAIDTLKWYQHSKKAVQANRNMETTNDLVTFDPVDQVSVQATVVDSGLLSRPLQFLLDEASSRAITGLSLSCSPIAFKLAIISFI